MVDNGSFHLPVGVPPERNVHPAGKVAVIVKRYIDGWVGLSPCVIVRKAFSIVRQADSKSKNCPSSPGPDRLLFAS